VLPASAILTALIAATPAIAFVDGPIARGVIELIAASLLGITAFALPSGEGRHLTRLIAPVAVCLTLPAIWIVVQALPMPFFGLSHPIWESAATALHKPLTGSISADPGATLVALATYLTMAGILVACAALTIDRRRAERLLFWIAGATALAGMVLTLATIAGTFLADWDRDGQASRALIAQSALGVPVTAAAAGHVFERYERRRTRAEMSPVRFALLFLGCIAALTMCLAGLACAAAFRPFVASLCGLGIVAVVVAIRRSGLGFWAGAAAAATVSIAVVAFIAARGGGHGDITLRYAEAPLQTTAIAESLLSDTGWAGSGAGTYRALAPIYKGVDGDARTSFAPTAAVEIAIELGRPALWVIIAMTLAALGLLLRGALTRGRDSFYASAGAGSAAVFALEAFYDTGGLVSSAMIIAAAAFGLGLAQSVSRTLQ
jgi:hypothetical protein